nr:PREDICTED: ceramide-1-phosphate transfer protein isoform X4 [Latimeria chalumnae]|eukprot:XP_014343457.1 PREDICTED: ceramide-1-phosphate transfer protein isoform X4 [Latimeria chalumnae]
MECKGLPFNIQGYRHLQALRFAVEEINNSSVILPNVTLGYDLFDDCYEAVGIMATFNFLSKPLWSNVKIQKDYITYQPKVSAVIGPTVSDTAVITSNMLSYFMVPQISYSAASEVLSNKRVFPSFLRTFPSDEKQAEAMVELLKEFQWSWIVVIGSDTEYSRRGKQELIKLAPFHELLEKVKTVNFSLYDKLIYFNEKGEAPTGYDIVMWNWTGESVSFDTIGTYSVKLGKVDLDARLINWPTEGNTAPVSVCSEDCLPGQKRKQAGPNICCFYCLTCPEGTYLNQSNLYECRSCHKDQWAPEGSPMCYERTKEYLSWKNNISLVLVSISTLGLVLTAAASIFFTVNLNTPVVKAAGGKLCLFMLVCLACCYCSVCLFIGKPTYVTCILRQLVFPISYTACLSCLVLRSFQIMCIFKMAARLPVSFDYWVKHNGQYIFIYMVTAVQIFLACFWIGISDNEPLFDYHFKDAIVLKCGEYTTRAIITEVAYTGLLSALCFIFSYTGEELPRNYNEAKCITFTMLIYFISIICYFMFDKAQSERNTTMWLVICILARLYGILGGYFFPKCYIILFKPKQNTAAFFRACIQNYTN